MSKPFIAFDFDGTFFKSSIAEKFIEDGVDEGILASDVFDEARATKRKWQENNNEEVYQTYLRQLVGGMVVSMAGVEVADVESAVERLKARHDVRMFALPRLIMEALSDSHEVVVISGSPTELVRPFVADRGITRVYGSTYEVVDGKYTGTAHPVGDKAVLLEQLVQNGEVLREGSVAMGDTISDASMLEYADCQVMFNSSLTLMRHGEQFGWNKAFEVKDNIVILGKSPNEESYSEASLEDLILSLKIGRP